MYYKNTSQHYGCITITLHWLTVLLIIVQVLLAVYAGMEPIGLTKFVLLSRHKALGMLILIITLFRLIWRWSNPVPDFPTGMSPLERTLALLTHGCFYIILITMPIIGWFLSSAANTSINFFALFIFPDLIAPDKSLVAPLKLAHQLLAWSLAILLLLHIAAALRHHFICKDTILSRMLPLIKRRGKP